MGRIVLRVSVYVISQAVMTVFFSSGDLFPQVVEIAAFAVDDLPEYSFTMFMAIISLLP